MSATTEILRRENPGLPVEHRADMARLKDMLAGAYSPRTLEAYAAALDGYFRWLGSGEVNDRTLAAYCNHRWEFDGVGLATVKIIVAAAMKHHELSGANTAPPKGNMTKHLLKAMARAAAGDEPRQARGLKWEQVDALTRQCRMEAGYAGIRDAAIIMLAFVAGLRISEIVALDVADVRDDVQAVSIRRSKTDQEGNGKVMALTDRASDYLRDWIKLAGLSPGEPLFHRIHHSGATQNIRRGRMMPDSMARMFKRRARLYLGDAEGISGHSLRVGMAQSLAEGGTSLVDMQTAGRWKSPDMPAHYARGQLATKDSPMVRLLDGDK